MTDERYAFVEDVKTRKNIARSAAHKVSGAKSKKCNFPSDYLSRKEREALNGTMKVWDLNKFYTLEKFLEMPQDIQVSYINHMTETWKIGTRAISTILFGKNPYYLDNYARYHNLSFTSHGVSGHGAKKYSIAFAEAVNNSEKKEIKEAADTIYEELKEEEPVINNVELTEKVNDEIPKTPSLKRVELEMTDGLDYYLLDAIYQRFHSNCKFTIIIEEAE